MWKKKRNKRGLLQKFKELNEMFVVYLGHLWLYSSSLVLLESVELGWAVDHSKCRNFRIRWKRKEFFFLSISSSFTRFEARVYRNSMIFSKPVQLLMYAGDIDSRLRRLEGSVNAYWNPIHGLLRPII